jgi:hypothetical protein
LRPSPVQARISSCANSAIPARIINSSRPWAVVISAQLSNRSTRHLDLTFQAHEQGTPPASGTGNGETGLTTLASGIDALELRYFRKGKGAEAGSWWSDWRGQEELPALISIKVKSAKAGVVWPELLIAPRVKSVDWR